MTFGAEKRRYKRIGYDMPVEFSLQVLEGGSLRQFDLTGTGVDISEEGLGFITDFQLEPEHFIRIKRADGTYQLAMVRWVGRIDGKYRVGVLFYKD
ncbi:MAG: PilZ domain-containing protein [Nitrospirae bacterium]|nr:PilZ domain-containing protein [Nitrospirota bacterium]